MRRQIFPILSPGRLAALLGRTKADLEDLAAAVDQYYAPGMLRLPGKDRRIFIPFGELATIQRRILTRVFRDFSPTSCSFGGVRGRSAYWNAKSHLGSRFLAKLDIRNFYPSVSYQWVQSFFETKQGCSPPVANLLRRLLTFQKGLPQGTCTSPALADQLMTSIDSRLQSAFAGHHIRYTRFVDDLTFSADFSLRKVTKLVAKILRDYGLHVNHKKTRYYGPNDKPVVTGYTLGRRLGLPRLYTDTVAAELLQAKMFALGQTPQPPPYGKETYWGTIHYIRRTEPRIAAALLTQFDDVDWAALDHLHLPSKKAKVERLPT